MIRFASLSVNEFPWNIRLFPPYQLFDQYDAVINNGQRGPYFVDDVEYVENFEAIKSMVLKDCKANDVVLILGAGTIEKLAKMF